MGCGTTATLKTVEEVAGGVRNTHMVTTGVVKAVTTGNSVLSKVESVAPFLGKIAPYAEKAAPILEKVAIPITAVAGTAKAAWQFSGGHNREGSQTLGQTGGIIAGSIGGAEGGAAIGTLICPGLGTAIGGGVGGIIGGFAGSSAGKWLGGWIHDRVVDVKHSFNSAASGTPEPAPAHLKQSAPAPTQALPAPAH